MSTSILHWTWLMPALMALSFLAILAFGKRLPRKGSEIGIAAVGLCFLFAILSAASWIGHVNDSHHVAAPPERTTQVAESGTNAQAEGETPVEPITTPAP